jgi:tol-pal system protein YbgF
MVDRRVISMVAAMAALAVFAGAGCTSQNDMQQLNQNQFTLRGMIANDRQQIDALQQQVRQLKDEIAQMKHGGATTAAGADQTAAVNDRLGKLESEVNALQAGIAAAPAAGSVTAPPGTTGLTPGAPAGTPAAAPVAEIQPTWPQELDQEITAAQSSREAGVKTYREGLKAMKDGKYPLAILRFAKLQHQYPKSPLTEPAEYFAANALFETGKYDQAILQFNDLVMRFPKGRFASQSLLRESQAFLKMNDRIDARLTLQKLLADHPGTPEATAANTLLKGLVSD